MEHHTSTSAGFPRLLGIPSVVWVILAGVAAALVAIFVFKVATNTVLTYGFLSLMLLHHMFMHGGHASHGAHDSQTSLKAGDETDNDQNAGHGGCHLRRVHQ